MATTRRGKPPLQDAAEYAAKGLDKTTKLEVKFINSFKGRGVFAKALFQKGDFVVEYRGELINFEESLRRRRAYHVRCSVFMFDFYWHDKTWCVDAAKEDGSLGRLVNDEQSHPNCKMKKVLVDGKPHLFLFALRDINPGEEITYNYGPSDFPWRKQLQVEGQTTTIDCSEAEVCRTSDDPPQRSPCSQIEEQSTTSNSSEAQVCRTSDDPPQGSLSSQIQIEEQSTTSNSSEAQVCRTSDDPPQRSPCSQSTVKPEPHSSTFPMFPTKLSLVRYTNSDECQSSSTDQVHFDIPCQKSSPSSDSELSDKDKDPLPRLRRTKSIQMNFQTRFDSDELFDPTSDDSGEEYIPKTSEDSDVTDTSCVLETDGERSNIQFKCLNLGEMPPDNIKEEHTSPTVINNSCSKPVLNRGHSSPTKGSNSCMKQKKHYLRSASLPVTQTKSSCSKHRKERDTEALLENSTADMEQSLPNSASSLQRVDDIVADSLCIPAVCKKENGSRIYNKKQYCLYCKLGIGKMARHLERVHQDEPEVAQALSFPKGSKERRMHLEHIRNRGNFQHNVEVLNAGAGNLVPRKQPKQDSEAQNFLHCVYCQGFFSKNLLWRHMKVCKFKPSVPQKPGKTRVQALCGFSVPPPPGVKVEFWKLLNNMVQDEVYSAVKSDACILEYGEHLYNRLGYDVSKHEYIRQKLRELGRLLICSRKTTPLKTMEDHIKPANFMHVVQAVKSVAGHDSETSAYKCPSLALKIGHSLKKVSLLVESRANVQNNHSAAKDARSFRRVYETRWNELVSAASLRTLQEAKWNAPLLLPFIEDVQTLHSYLDIQQRKSCSILSTETSPQTWAQLAKITLTQVILFNRRRAGEVSKMPLSAYLSQNPSDPSEEDVSLALSDLEKKLCQHFRRLEIRGKRGRKVPVLLTPAMQEALDLLVSKRQESAVPQGNMYLFARPSAFTCYRGSDCLRHFAKICGAKSPESLTSTKLRKQTATLSQVLNLSNTELDQLADFLGHDIRVHRQFYRLPEGTLQLAKISKVLMALETGRLAEFKGKTLDDISIDPEENVHMDSDAEMLCDSDLQESPVSENQVASSHTEENETMSDLSHENAEPQQDTITPPAARHHRSPKRIRGRQPFKRRVWNEQEIHAVEKHMMSFITSCRVPGKSDCDKCLQLEKVALKDRNWLAIKFYVKNRISALKNKV